MRKIYVFIGALLLAWGLSACGNEKEPLESAKITEGPYTFEIPQSFIKDEKKSGGDKVYYVSGVYGEASYVLYEKLSEKIRLEELTEEVLIKETNKWLKEEFLTNTKAEIKEYSLTDKGEEKMLSYVISYNLYSAIVNNNHFYYEKEGELYHLEYYDVEEEGYHTSFDTYRKNVIIE